MKTIEVAPSARKELSATVEWYEARSQGLGVRFFEVVDEAFTSIDRELRMRLLDWT